MVTSVFGRYDFDKAQGIILPLYMILGSAGAGVVGTVSDLGGVTAVMLLLAGLCVLSLILLGLLPENCIGRNESPEIEELESEES